MELPADIISTLSPSAIVFFDERNRSASRKHRSRLSRKAQSQSGVEIKWRRRTALRESRAPSIKALLRAKSRRSNVLAAPNGHFAHPKRAPHVGLRSTEALFGFSRAKPPSRIRHRDRSSDRPRIAAIRLRRRKRTEEGFPRIRESRLGLLHRTGRAASRRRHSRREESLGSDAN